MKIIYVENVRIPSERAHAYQIVQACAWFARAGHGVTLVNPDRAGGKDVFAAYGLPVYLFRHVRLRVIDPLSWSWFRWKKIAFLLERHAFSRALTRWSAGERADIWYTRDPAMVDVLKDPGRRFVLELHDRPDTRPGRWRRIRDSVWKFVVISRGLKDALVALGIAAERIHVAPDGYDPKDFLMAGNRAEERRMIGVPADAFVAIYTGSFYPWKGVDEVVRAWSLTDQSAHLVLIGGPARDRERIERLVASSVASRIHIFPARERSHVLRALAAADVALLTSSPSHEIGRVFTSPIKQFEYLAAGLPIVASDVPSSREILTPDVAEFYAPDAFGFAAALKRAQNDTAWRENARFVGRRLVAPYTWEARARGILDFLG